MLQQYAYMVFTNNEVSRKYFVIYVMTAV